MRADFWTAITPGIVALLIGVGAWLRAQAAHARLNAQAKQQDKM